MLVLLLLAFLLLLAEMFLPERRTPFRREPGGGLKRAGLDQPSPRSFGPAGAGVSVAVLVAWFGLAVGGSASASPADALRAYNAGRYVDSLTEYQRLAQVHTNDLRLVFNAGVAAYRATNYDEALKNFKMVTVAPDLKLQQQAYYNLGNTQYRMGIAARDLDGLQETWEAATNSFDRAVELDKNDADAANNLEFVRQQMGMILQFREAMRRMKAEADAAVRRSEYHRALEIMESLNNPIVAKKFQDYVKKLKDIDAIVTPNHR